MKHISEKCILMLFCLVLGGCGSRTEAYLESEREFPGTEEAPVQEDPAATESTGEPILVYVCGEVVSPGVYELKSGMRICDAVEAAGGFTDNAGRDYWNLAEPLTDGQMLYFPTEEEAKERRESAGEQVSSSGAAEADLRININTADAEELQKIPGIGQTRAESILAYRSEHGSFGCIEDIMKVSGIKNALFEKMRNYITVD